MAVLATDSGTGTDESPLATNWSTLSSFNGLRRVSNQFANVTANSDSAAYYDTITAPNDQYSKVTVATVGGADGGPAIRMTSTSNCYFLTNYNGSTIFLYSVVNGSYDVVDSDTGTYATNDVLYLEAQGTALISKKNGTTVNNISNASLSSGNIGMFIYDGTIRFTTFEAGDFTAGGAMNGSVSFSFSEAGTLTGAGALSSAITATFGGTKTLSGAGALASTVPVTFSETGTLTGTGALASTLPLVFSGSGTLEGAGALSSNIQTAFSSSGSLLGDGVLASTIAAQFSVSGTLENLSAGAMSGSVSATFSVSGSLLGDGALSGVVSGFSFGVSGTLEALAAGEDTIDGSASYLISTAYGSVLVYHRGDRRFFTISKL